MKFGIFYLFFFIRGTKALSWIRSNDGGSLSVSSNLLFVLTKTIPYPNSVVFETRFTSRKLQNYKTNTPFAVQLRKLNGKHTFIST